MDQMVIDKKFCKYCDQYDRESKMCNVTKTFTARKKTCEHFTKKKQEVIMGVSRNEMIRVIKQHKDRNGNPYKYVNVIGGRVELEKAENKYVCAMYHRLTKQGVVKHEQQLELGLV